MSAILQGAGAATAQSPFKTTDSDKLVAAPSHSSLSVRGKRYRSDGINSFGSSLIARPSFSAVDTKRRSDEEDGQCCHELHLIQVWVSSPEVIDIRSLKPFDLYTIGNSVKKTHRALIVEECMRTGGIGASLTAAMHKRQLS